MPSVSKAQQMMMGAELERKRAGKKTVTGMTETQIEDFAGTKQKGLPVRKKVGQGHWGNEKQSAGGSKTLLTEKEMMS